MQITKLEYQKKDKNRVNVYIDGKFMVGIGADEVVRLGLYKDKEIGTEELNKIIGESEFGKLLNSALNFLSYRPRSRQETTQFLYRKISKIKDNSSGIKGRKIETGKWEDTVKAALDKLGEIGQIDDEAFARWFVEQRRSFRPKGKRVIQIELTRKGIDRHTIDKVLAADDNTSERALAIEALQRKIKSQKVAQAQVFCAERTKLKVKMTSQNSKAGHERGGDVRAKIRLQHYLLNRGFDWETAKEAVEKVAGGCYNNSDSD